MKVDLVEFARYLHALNRSKNTIEAYIRDLLSLDGKELSDEVIRKYITSLKGKPATKNRKLTALKMLLRFYKYNYELPRVKQVDNRREYKIITQEELEERIKGLDSKWKCIIRFLYYYALRVSEINQVDIKDNVIIVRRKGGKIQKFPLIPQVEGCKSIKVSRQRVYQVVRKIFGISPHHLRASRLTILAKKNPTIAIIIAGHSNPKTTMRYIQPSLDDIRKVLT